VNLEEIGLVLAKLAAFDQRTVGEADLLAWHEVIGRFDLQDCLTAVTTHYTETRDRAMPADIRHLAIGIRDRRKATAEQLALAAAPPLADRSEVVKALVRQVADALPKPDLHERAKARARRERGRPAPPPSREPKRGKSAKRQEYPEPASSDVSKLATRYLLDGYPPTDVAERLAVSRKWCERTIRRLRPEGATA
jgi:hypothetical protein